MHGKPCFYGSATVGAKGQIVIPSEAREELGIAPGDKLVIIGVKDGQKQMLGVCPVKSVEVLLGTLSDHLQSMQKVIAEVKKEG